MRHDGVGRTASASAKLVPGFGAAGLPQQPTFDQFFRMDVNVDLGLTRVLINSILCLNNRSP